MVKLLAALGEARDRIDMNIAFGEAAPVLGRIKNTVLVALVLAAALLGVGYMNLQGQIDDLQSEAGEITVTQDVQTRDLTWVQNEMLKARKQREALLVRQQALMNVHGVGAGQKWANTQR